MLHRKGLTHKLRLGVKKQRSISKGFDWKNAFIDSAIIAAITMLSILGTLVSVDMLTAQTFTNMLTLVGTEFFGVIAAKRGLITTVEPQTTTITT